MWVSSGFVCLATVREHCCRVLVYALFSALHILFDLVAATVFVLIPWVRHFCPFSRGGAVAMMSTTRKICDATTPVYRPDVPVYGMTWGKANGVAGQASLGGGCCVFAL